MKKLRWLLLLMGITLAAITGFQVFWLGENYTREKRTLHIKTQMAFGEAMRDLQVKKFRLGGFSNDSGKGEVKVFIRSDNTGPANRIPGKAEVVSTINIIRDKLLDSLKKALPPRAGMVISMEKTDMHIGHDSFRIRHNLPPGRPGEDQFIDLLYGVDSLQDSIKITDISKAYAKNLQEQKINIPFNIIRLDSNVQESSPSPTTITIGFAHPVTYSLKLGNSFPYLLKRISLPIIFSVLLLGITILSFVMLYRNLLKQRRLAELKNEFISNITHELKTPIATVGVAIEALKNFNAMNDPAKTREYLDISANELQRLSLLVDKVLKLSMFEKKEMDLRFEPVQLDLVAKEVIASMRLQTEKHKATIDLVVEGDTIVSGDKLHLLSVIFNLLDNALKYSKGEPKISMRIKGDNDTVEMSIRDNGIGIPAEYREKIFDKFFRVPHGDTHNAKGYGLGLSYAAQVIRKHGGTIRIEPGEESGTCFIFTLPKYQA
ncbi:MAG: HAMP domain-containing histidine kinase [Chitinophagaceae bacterium]|nr:HAMP domain-containing histidine kinase [Chitinophagaceae bacterium]